ncbi:acyltransferase [Loktanella sp. IMCC34160]|uniref:acyltransferase family protein n=1 Tax=Loktanella sp. IMCC34160 TaxID=2510646 RepID=UPI00101CE2C0|nr:acyltransferase family protein [Loktanella sp. IMCC34160]RYG91795.1 acyltransferase [Loktanella sp. IMCC34160]
MTYRSEIDGLRAIAVLAVIAYHADDRILPTGYLGVDIFFVISGFLITGLLVNDLRNGNFSFAKFYERRARRILPVLFVVLAATVPFAYWLMLPSQLAEFGQGLLATLLFSSNILFWSNTGYFMADAELNPLLHMWSLAVEEQFYLIFPVLVLIGWKLPRKIGVAGLLALLVASLATCLWLVDASPSANFYLLGSRAWELLVGAAAALLVGRAARVPDLAAHGIAVAGLAVMVYSLVGLDTFVSTPSLATMPLVFATAAVVLFARGPVAGVLSLRPLVGVGLISYGAYLWHVPVLVFARLWDATPASPARLAGLVGLSLALATITYFLVERPFRRRGGEAVVSLGRLLVVLPAGAVALGAVAVVIMTAPLRGDDSVAGPDQMIEAKIATNYGLHEDCEWAFTLSPNCRTSDHPRVLLWGDSFAMHLAPALSVGTGWDGMIQHTKSVCAPVPGLAVVTAEYPETWAEGCIAFNEEVLAWLEDQPSIRYVVASSPFGMIHHNLLQRSGEILDSGQADAVRQSMIDTTRQLEAQGKTLVYVSPPPVTGENLGQCLATVLRNDQPHDTCDFLREDAHPANDTIFEFLRSTEPDVRVLYLDRLICPDGLCDTMIGTTFMFRDAGHLSIEGSTYLGTDKNFYEEVRRVADR